MTGARRWQAGAGGIRLDDLLVSFQRFLRPGDGVVARAPPSLGSLPVARAQGRFLLPLRAEEAFWIGITLERPGALSQLVLRMLQTCGTHRLAVRLSGLLTVVPGVSQGGGRYAVFSHPTLRGVCVQATGRGVVVRVVDPDSYTLRSGLPAPGEVDASAGYGGWRLP
jgi:hypothetical protein